MRFIIEDKVFEILPDVCFGVVVARGLNNSGRSEEIWNLLEQAVAETRDKFGALKPKDHPDMQPYRNSFQKMGINPNRFPCSVEALTTRVVKGGSLPDINPAVNLINAYSLKYTLPMGAHDLDAAGGDIKVRFSKGGDIFVPFGQTESESLDEAEMVYASGDMIKTRKWIWRQSEQGKVTGTSENIFCPIDGFTGYNRAAVLQARYELAAGLENFLGAETSTYYLDRDNRAVQL